MIDTDPGLDDAVALWLALASPALHLLAITATGGNVGLALTLANARAIVSLAGSGVPVHGGADRALAGVRANAAHVHGADGLGAISLPEGRAAASGLAADAIRDLLRDAPAKVTLVGIGPATNLALALSTEPALAADVEEIVLMSGAVGQGNITPHAEFNAHGDPEALAILLHAGPVVTFATLDLTEQALVTPERLAALRAAGRCEGQERGRCLAAACDLLDAIPHQQRYAASGGRPVHDACAIAWLLAPHLFTARLCQARVVLDGEARGRTVFSDMTDAQGRTGPNARLLETIDPDGFFALLGGHIARLP